MIGVTDSTSFSFWTCQQDENYNEHFGVAIATAAAPTGNDFATIEEFDIHEYRATEWTQHSVDLSKMQDSSSGSLYVTSTARTTSSSTSTTLT